MENKEYKRRTVSTLQQICYDIAKEKGWTEKEVCVPEMIALIHSEASEALEAYRNNEPLFWLDKDGKPCGLASEFADIFIRMGHYATLLGFDLEYEIVKKLVYNKTRLHRHGGKVC